MSDSKLKVTDKRMFTRDGELREEFQHLEEGGTAEPRQTPAPSEPAAKPDPAPTATEGSAAGADRSGEVEPSSGDEGGAGTSAGAEDSTETAETEAAKLFPELVAMLAEPAALYLGDAQLPDGRSMEDPRMARLHIDLLETLQQKTAGNLDDRESAMLESVLYQLRVRYVQKHGPS